MASATLTGSSGTSSRAATTWPAASSMSAMALPLVSVSSVRESLTVSTKHGTDEGAAVRWAVRDMSWMILEPMRPFTDTLPFDEALRRVHAGARPTERTERVALSSADGRVLQGDVTALIDVPPFDRAAMDGYAVIAADTAGASQAAPIGLTLAGRLFTGEQSLQRIAPGTCMEIATGAPMPTGADAVVMVEHTRLRQDNRVLIHHQASPRQHVGARGGDIMAGHLVLQAGSVLTPARIGVLAALGQTAVEVYARPRVAILCTGEAVTE